MCGADQIKELAVLHLLGNALQSAEGLVKINGEAHAREVLAHALLDDGPQTHALLLLRRLWQPVPPLWRWQLLLEPVWDGLCLLTIAAALQSTSQLGNHMKRHICRPTHRLYRSGPVGVCSDQDNKASWQ